MKDEQKLAKLQELEQIIKTSKDEDATKAFITGALYVIEECNESWCDSCGIRKATGMLCNEYLNII